MHPYGKLRRHMHTAYAYGAHGQCRRYRTRWLRKKTVETCVQKTVETCVQIVNLKSCREVQKHRIAENHWKCRLLADLKLYPGPITYYDSNTMKFGFCTTCVMLAMIIE